MIIPMSYWKLTDDEIVKHYDAVASKISIPIMAYNNPATSGVDMSPVLLKRLLEIPNVTMIKESTGDVQRMHYLRKELGEEVAFIMAPILWLWLHFLQVPMVGVQLLQILFPN